MRREEALANQLSIVGHSAGHLRQGTSDRRHETKVRRREIGDVRLET